MRAAETRMISADSHINEPPDLWTSRLSERFVERAPHIKRLEQGDAWILEAALDPINFGSNCSAGLAADLRSPWIRWDEVPSAGYDPAARLTAQDQDGVVAEVLYPTPRLANHVLWYTVDREFHLECVRAYNDWLQEFCTQAPDRLWGVALIPNVGADEAIEEMQRVTSSGVIRAGLLARYPTGGERPEAADDRFFGAAEELSLPLSIHVAFATGAQGDKKRGKATGDMRFFDAPIRASQFINSGIFDRFPHLQLALVEVDGSWIPYVKEQMDDRFLRANPRERAQINRLPSDYFAANISSTFVTDRYGIRNRDAIGVTQMMWSSDFPHGGSDWPRSRDSVDHQFDGVADDELALIVEGNARNLYGKPLA